VSLLRIGSFAAVTFSFVMVAATAASAQDDIRKRGDKACGSDSRRMCKQHFGQGDMAVLGCLQQNKVKLGGSCRKFLVGIGQLQ
jgi:hypothetical protein